MAPADRLAVVPRPGAAQSELRIGHVCASRATPDYHALLLLNTILGGQFVSRVNLNLREDKGYTYGARTGIDLRRGLGPVRAADERADEPSPPRRSSRR
jgi:zinc protease